MNPGPATSARSTKLAGGSASTSTCATSRGGRPARLAIVSATLVEKSPCSFCRGVESSGAGSAGPRPSAGEAAARPRGANRAASRRSPRLASIAFGRPPPARRGRTASAGTPRPAPVPCPHVLDRLAGQEDDGHAGRASDSLRRRGRPGARRSRAASGRGPSRRDRTARPRPGPRRRARPLPSRTTPGGSSPGATGRITGSSSTRSTRGTDRSIPTGPRRSGAGC